jgi:hypothetical protein
MPKFLGRGPYDVLNMLEFLGNKIWPVDGCAFGKKMAILRVSVEKST